MISGYELELQPYCEHCPEFEVEQIMRYADAQATYILRCEHADRCRNIAKKLKEKKND